MAIDVEERVDVSDIDLFDDVHEHAICLKCYPDFKPLEPFIALCGKKVIDPSGITEVKDYVPPDACPKCVLTWLLLRKCPRCGHE